MKTKMKNWIASALMFMALPVLACAPVHAEENTEAAQEAAQPAQPAEGEVPVEEENPVTTPVHTGVALHAEYATGIGPKAGDVFEIRYSVGESADEGLFQVDASYLTEGKTTIDMDPGSYRITGIEYLGNNSGIDGVAVNRSFSISDNNDGEITLLIGKDLTDGLNDDYIISDITEAESGDDSGDSKDADGDDSSDKADKKSSSDEDTDEDEEPADPAEDQEDEESPYQGFSLLKGLPLLIMAVIAMVVIWIMHKKGKI